MYDDENALMRQYIHEELHSSWLVLEDIIWEITNIMWVETRRQ